MAIDANTSPPEPEKSYRGALRLLHDCSSPVGFLVSPVTN
jgi:hypothetical protein